MRKLLFLLSGYLLGAGVAQAQTTDPASASSQQLAQDLGVERIRTALTLTPAAADTRNVTSLLQAGTGNLTVINQTNQAFLANQAAIQQNGTGNGLNLDQTGSNNQTSFSQAGNANQAALRQNGTTNTIVGQVTGNSNNVNVDQQGIGNQYSTQLTGNQGRYVIDQVGNNNSLTQRETSTTTPLPGYEVKMEGNNMHLTIEQGKVFP